MADRVNYFLLGLLFLIVAGVIAYDRWNPGGDPAEEQLANRDHRATVTVEPSQPATPSGTIRIDTEGRIDTEERPNQPASRGTGGRPEHRTLDVDGKLFGEAPEQDRELLVVPPSPAPQPVVRPRVVTPTPPSAERFHVVQPGESLELIAVHYYGTKRGVSAIIAANRISNPDRIYAKQRLVIPAMNESVRGAPVAPRPAASRPAPIQVPSSYTVKRNDGNLFKICARFYGSDKLAARVDQVMDINGLWSAEVTVGSTLQLPPR